LKISARHRFVAALGLYLAWVAALTALAVTSSSRPAPAKAPPVAAPASSEAPSPTDGNPEAEP